MKVNKYLELKNNIESRNAKLIVVTKNQKIEDIIDLYQSGCRVFAENRVQNLLDRIDKLPNDIEWHLIGNLQKNKVKSILPHISLIQSVDSLELVEYINSCAAGLNLNIRILLQVKIAQEETKAGFDKVYFLDCFDTQFWDKLTHITVCGLMGMASFTNDLGVVRSEFNELKNLFFEIKNRNTFGSSFTELSMGMSGDYQIALEEQSTMVRIGSLIFES